MADLRSISGHHIYVSGAGSGIGRAIALDFARRGAKISACDINTEAIKATENGSTIKAIGADFTNEASILNSVKNAEQIGRAHV